MQKERWKPLIYGDVNLSDRLMVSDHGKIWSLVTHKILKPRKNESGYWYISTSLGSRDKHINVKIHRAVAFMFVDGYKKGLTVNHIDGNKDNSMWTNLEWISRRANVKHAVINGLIPWSKAVICNETNQWFPSIAEACDWCGLNSAAGSMRNYFLHPEKRRTAGKHPITGERLTWRYA